MSYVIIHFFYLQIARANIRLQVKWAVNLVIAAGHLWKWANGQTCGSYTKAVKGPLCIADLLPSYPALNNSLPSEVILTNQLFISA